MRVLITGFAGFAGQHLARCCAAHGAEVVGLGRRESPGDDLLAQVDGYVGADLLDRSATERALDEVAPDLVFHLAAEASVARSWKDPAAAVVRNVSSTLNVLESLRLQGAGTRLLVACSGEEYGAPEQLPVDERHALRPRSPYGVGKAMADQVAGFYADTYGMPVVRTRAFNHTGPGQGAEYVVAGFARQIALAEQDGHLRDVEVVTGNLAMRRDFTDVRDVVEAYWRALERAEPEAYNVCSGRSVGVEELLAGVSEHTRLDVRSRVDPALLREHEVMEIVGSHEKLTSATGWEPEIPLEQTLHDALDWWRQRCAAGVRA